MLHLSLFATPKPAFIVAYDYLAHWHDLGVALKLISLFGLFISFYDISVVKPLSHASDSLPYIKAVKISDCPSGVARPAKQPEFQLVLHQG